MQVNGKVRDRVDVPVSLSEDELVERAKASPRVQAHLDGAAIRRTIVVPGKLVNFVVASSRRPRAGAGGGTRGTKTAHTGDVVVATLDYMEPPSTSRRARPRCRGGRGRRAHSSRASGARGGGAPAALPAALERAAPAPAAPVVVHVVGAVRRPELYRLEGREPGRGRGGAGGRATGVARTPRS